METKIEFDLNAALRLWREQLGHSPQFRAENLDELEAHLRDSVATLRSKGLSAEEAFLIAARRTGSPDALGNEFAKVNAREVWLNRVLWMLVGVLSWWFITAFARVTAESAVVGGLLGFGCDLNPAPGQAWATNIAVLYGGANAVMLILGIWFCSRLVRRSEHGLRMRAASVLRRPGLLGLAVAAGFVVLAAVQFLGYAETAFLLSKLRQTQLGLISVSRMWGTVVFSLIQTAALLVCTALLARRLHLRKSGLA